MVLKKKKKNRKILMNKIFFCNLFPKKCSKVGKLMTCNKNILVFQLYLLLLEWFLSNKKCVLHKEMVYLQLIWK